MRKRSALCLLGLLVLIVGCTAPDVTNKSVNDALDEHADKAKELAKKEGKPVDERPSDPQSPDYQPGGGSGSGASGSSENK